MSLSLGAACLSDIELHSGDLLVFGEESRLAYHGVPKLLPHVDVPDTGLSRGQLNITLRVSGLGRSGLGS